MKLKEDINITGTFNGKDFDIVFTEVPQTKVQGLFMAEISFSYYVKISYCTVIVQTIQLKR